MNSGGETAGDFVSRLPCPYVRLHQGGSSVGSAKRASRNDPSSQGLYANDGCARSRCGDACRKYVFLRATLRISAVVVEYLEGDRPLDFLYRVTCGGSVGE